VAPVGISGGIGDCRNKARIVSRFVLWQYQAMAAGLALILHAARAQVLQHRSKGLLVDH